MLLLKSRQLGDKDSELNDFFAGHARRGVRSAPYTDGVMQGIELAQKAGLLGQAHFDMLGSDALFRYWKRTGFVGKGVSHGG